MVAIWTLMDGSGESVPVRTHVGVEREKELPSAERAQVARSCAGGIDPLGR